jgi:hypothetical protein
MMRPRAAEVLSTLTCRWAITASKRLCSAPACERVVDHARGGAGGADVGGGVGRQRRHVEVGRGGDGVGRVGADLEVGAGEAAVEQGHAVELGVVGHAGDLLDQLVDFALQVGTVIVRQRAVGRLHRQLADTLQVVGDLAHRAFGGLEHRDAVVGVADRHVWAYMRSAIARPAASSLALLTRRPEDRRCIEVASEDWLVLRLRCALSETTLVLMVMGMASLL